MRARPAGLPAFRVSRLDELLVAQPSPSTMPCSRRPLCARAEAADSSTRARAYALVTARRRGGATTNGRAALSVRRIGSDLAMRVDRGTHDPRERRRRERLAHEHRVRGELVLRERIAGVAGHGEEERRRA